MLKRILMNQVDASPGNSAGAAPSDVPAADVPQAQGAAPAMTKEMADAIASAVSSAVAGVKDSIFAEARRTFTAPKQSKAQADAATAPVPGSAPDPLKLRSLDRELSKAGLAARLTDAQYQRAEKAFAAEDPADTGAWVADYFNGFTAANPTTTPPAPQATQAAPAQPTNAQPASSRGAPPAPQVPLDEMNVWTMSVADRDAFIAKHGMKKYLEKARNQGKSISIDPRR